MDDYNYKLSGSLLESRVQCIERSHLEKCRSLRFRKIIGDSRWEEFDYSTSLALRGENRDLLHGPYEYKIVCRRSGSRIALLSHNRKIIDHLSDELVAEVFSMKMRRVSIAVDSLVRTLVERPTRYSLSFVYARVPAFGAALRNVSFFGDDLGEASFFRENVQLIKVVVCGLRRTEGGSEILRLTSDGRISFSLQSAESVLAVEEVLRFLREQRYLSTDFLPLH